MRTWIRAGTLITPDHTAADQVIVIADGRIAAVEPRSQLTASPEDTHLIAADGLYVMPGLIDIHVHGGAGSDTMDATPEALAAMSRFFLQHGVTAYLATTGTQTTDRITKAIENVANTRSERHGAKPLGVYLEGPYLSYPYRGAHKPEWLRNPDPEEYAEWLQSGMLRIVAVAPELPGALELIQECQRRGIRTSAAHTDASPQQIQAAADAGLTVSTHTFNGMAGLHHRDLGTVGALLADDRIYCEIIADGIHVHPSVLAMVLKIKGPQRTLLITDAIRAAGLADGQYELVGQMVTVTDGVARTPAGGLAGSTLTLDQAVKNIRAFAGIPLNQAVQMATKTPAAALGLSGVKGEIRPGADADLLITDADLNIKAVLIGGKIAYQTSDFQENTGRT